MGNYRVSLGLCWIIGISRVGGCWIELYSNWKDWNTGVRGQFLATQTSKEIFLPWSPSGFDPADPGELVEIKGCDGHTTDGSLSLGEGKASGRVDVPVGETQQAISLIDVNFTPLRRSPRSAFVTPGSDVEKEVFFSRFGGEDKDAQGHRSHGSMEIVEEEMDMWVTVNGKREGMQDSMVHIGKCDHDTIRCYGRLRGGAQRYRQPPQDIPGQWACSACGQERVWPTKERCFRCGNPRDHDPHPQNNSIVSPTGRPPQRTAPTNPSFRPNRRQNKISNQQALSQQQLTEEGATNDTLHPFVPGLRRGLVQVLLEGDFVSRGP